MTKQMRGREKDRKRERKSGLGRVCERGREEGRKGVCGKGGKGEREVREGKGRE